MITHFSCNGCKFLAPSLHSTEKGIYVYLLFCRCYSIVQAVFGWTDSSATFPPMGHLVLQSGCSLSLNTTIWSCFHGFRR
ncbi:hypothetical protein GDO78_021867 [Eleutherodactylus coqui]|uniref:Uncharacterized protein n=1 Tax=Eleutherodactylus coqui TaxID=57060 RepID=A0A8J6EGL5_ELECQ|nr:hypothetical protein GDO78_021867 [Eleutherodactylus coqui]